MALVCETAEGSEDPFFTFEKPWKEVFLYGKIIDDFNALNKGKLMALLFSATQEIDRIQQQESSKLLAAEARITSLETQNASLLSRLEALEKRLTDAEI